MKRAKKIASVLLAMLMVLAMGTTSLADGNDGSITVTNATVGETYAVYKVFDLNYKSSNVAYTYTKTGDADELFEALTSDASPFTLTATANSGVYSVVLNAGKTGTEVASFLKAHEGNLTEAAAEQRATTDTVKFDELDYGYYYITSTLGAIVTLDSTLKDVNVVDKNQGPTWDNGDNNPGKVILDADGNKVTENTVNYGDVVKFSIAVNATEFVGDEQVTYYYISDELATGFDAATDIMVYVNGTEIAASAYTLKEDGNTFQVTLPYDASYGSNAVIEVTYSATVNNAAVLAETGNSNTANFTYDTKTPGTVTPNPDPTPDYPESNQKVTKTYVYALGIVKVDPKGNVLQGAEFSVKNAAGKTISAKATETEGVYEYCASDDADAVTQFKTDAQGVLVLKGVAAGEYSVTEMVAPSGYNPLEGDTQVEAVMKEAYTTSITTYLDADGNVTDVQSEKTQTYTASSNVAGLAVVNQAGTELPSTGGIGTTLFYVLGGLLVAGAAVLLVVKKRMSRSAK